MSQVPTNRSTSNTPAEHVGDHNEFARLHNLIDTSGVTPLAVPAWVATTVYVAGQLSIDPSGNLVVRITGGTSRSSYDATEQALWFYPGGSPSGPAGGDLTGSYPNPTIGASTITDTKVAAGAAISPTKIALVNDGAFTSATQRTASYLHQMRRTTGVYYNPAGSCINAPIALTAGLQYFVRIHIERPVTIDQLAISWTTHATGGQIRMGMYADSGVGVPTGTALIDTGLLTAQVTNGTQAVGLTPYSVTTPGVYWLALLACSNLTVSATAALVSYNPSLEYGPTVSGAIAQNAYYISGLTTSLSTSSLTTIAITTWPLMSYRLSAVT